jgi:hypothetical protein
LKHGLFTRETVIRGEDEGEFAEHREKLLNQLIPGTPLEEDLAERVVDLSWRLKRAARDQEKAFVVLYQKHTAGVAGGTGIPSASLSGQALPVNQDHGRDAHATQRDLTIGWMIVADFNGEATLDRLLRYERRIESSMYRALNELRRVHDQAQKARQHELDTLARWKEEDWEAKKNRLFRPCPPPEVSAGPAGLTTNTPVPGAAIVQNEPNLEQVSSLEGQGLSEMCKTNPISDGGSSREGGYTPLLHPRL